MPMTLPPHFRQSMEIPIYQVDAFVTGAFTGNPAAVCLLDNWLDTGVMQRIAAENNQSETAFVVPVNHAFEIRWFTPKTEVDLCGHATLAAAFVLFHENLSADAVCTFRSASGELTVSREASGLLTMRFPLREATTCQAPALLEAALGVDAQAVFASRDYLVILKDEAQVAGLRPNMSLLAEIHNCLGIIVTAPGNQVDYVLRFFSPNAGTPEDPVTGSAQCTLIPYWAKRLDKKIMRSRQLSSRGGEIRCEALEDSVLIGGQARLYMKGTIFL